MLQALKTALLGNRCSLHDRRHRSELCPDCMADRQRRWARVDDRKEWTKSEGVWPVKRL